MRVLTGIVLAGLMALGSIGCFPGGNAGKVQGCKKCGQAPCVCKGEKVQGCKKCGKAPCVCKKEK